MGDEERDIMTDAQEKRFNEIVIQLGANKTLRIKRVTYGLWGSDDLGIIGVHTLREIKKIAREKGYNGISWIEGIQRPQEKIAKL